MYRTAMRSASRPALRSLRAHQSASRRFASSASPADKPRSWKSSALRWGLAAGALYYYNTSSVFAEEAASQTVSAPPSFAESDLPTVDSVLEEKRKQIRDKPRQPEPTPASQEQKSEVKESESKSQTSQTQASEEAAPAQGAEALEEEAGQQGAFNPETGEINWDCPCLGGMAHGPCGEEFKTAFSCFVYSEEDPKGMDCIEKFQGMQECFRQYPEIYGAELADEDDEPAQEAPEAPAAHTSNEPAVGDSQQLREHPPSLSIKDGENKLETDNLPGAAPVNDAVPTKWEDATAANEESKNEDAKAKNEA